ncbi:casein kinase II regulatory subunit-domain-containing protein [Pilobolus umbonatus]|nr:casein kinase II regulatory subunit-domain-containing protein [Pilobolus umbonatus]
MDIMLSSQGISCNSEHEADSQSSDGSLQSWISWFCSLSGHEYYLEVPEEFIEDEFNLTGLSTLIPYYAQALETILDMESGEYFEDEEEEGEEDVFIEEGDDIFWREETKKPTRLMKPDPRVIEPYAFMLYGLIHQRYLITRNGLRTMANRYSNCQFGVCPRYYCDQSPVLPVGQYDDLGKESVRLYCPRCLDIYTPPSTAHQCVDGAHFGTTYTHLLFLTYPRLLPIVPTTIYQPRIFGFRVNERSESGPRNQWLRMRQTEYTLDDDSGDEIDDSPSNNNYNNHSNHSNNNHNINNQPNNLTNNNNTLEVNMNIRH